MAVVATWIGTAPAAKGRARVPAQGRKDLSSSDAEQKLVERCLRGDEAAWESFVRAHARRIFSICYRFTGNAAQAEDITQEVFLKVFRSLSTYRADQGSLAVWLARLTRNLLIDHYRRAKLDRLTESIETQRPALEQRASVYGRTDGLLAGREASELLQKALQELSPELRETLILRDLEHLEYREIAQVLGIPEGTVKSRLNRARSELGRILRQWGVSP